MSATTNQLPEGPPVYEAYPVKRKRRTKAELAALDNSLIRIVQHHGRIGVRGAFYQCIKADLFEKTENNVTLVERRLLHLRRSGRVSYPAIVDESRIVYGSQRYDGLAGLADAAASLYRSDYWARSEVAIQIWVEKRGLSALLTPTVCQKWGLDLYVSAGQMSESYLYIAGNEIARRGKPTYVYALTDFDPGGETIYKTLAEGTKGAPGGLSRFSEGVPVYVEQLALTFEQVKAWGLPTRPAKKTDKRSAKFIEEHGDISVELDAVEPAVLIRLVDDAISRHMDPAELGRLQLVEDGERESVRCSLTALANADDEDDDEDEDEDSN